MIKILEGASIEEIEEFSREFTLIGWSKGNGYTFPVDKETGEVKLNDVNRANYEYCVAHPEKYIDEGVVKTVRRHRLPALAECVCGEKFRLYNTYLGASQCPECGRWYSLSGEEFKDPSEWGELDYDY